MASASIASAAGAIDAVSWVECGLVQVFYVHEVVDSAV